jgi:hypothetical protein
LCEARRASGSGIALAERVTFTKCLAVDSSHSGDAGAAVRNAVSHVIARNAAADSHADS